MRTKSPHRLIVLTAAFIFSFVLAFWWGFPASPDGAYAAQTQDDARANFARIFAHSQGGDIAPCREITDPYPDFNAVAVDPDGRFIVMSDTNFKSLLVYDLDEAGNGPDITPPRAQLKGPATYLSAPSGIALDPVDHKIYASETDVGDDIAVFPYTANGNFSAETLAVPHSAFGIAVNRKRKEMAVAIEGNDMAIVFRLGATGAELPQREIRGVRTGIADPHGLYWDAGHNEIGVANFGNWSRGYWDEDYNAGGHYQPPSIAIFAGDAKGDVAPLRVIQGDKTQLNWPSGLAFDPLHGEIAVANTAGHSVAIFKRTDNGNVAPVRFISGPRTGIGVAIGVAFDLKHDQIWVTNFGHEALAFDRLANGDVAPKRMIRNAPRGTPVAGFGLPNAIAFDTKRGQILAPN